MESKFLRHYIATVAYRAAKAIEDAPENYPEFELGAGVRQPIEILNHMGNVLAYALQSYGYEAEGVTETGSWEGEAERFYQSLEKLDEAVDKGMVPAPLTIEQIIQGPLSDVMTHIGQLYTLRRMAGFPVSKESFIKADIQTGKIKP
ncbi:hypothetical protein [Bacillus sp. 165]|uniref:hypothetical protein n=1 Tax=Bacillus sp. 165 TaxID=1529117 RepID=UPI001AD9E963|nr:hypothetical protein [Bacillus sp. 165]MBO9130890.1 hypothetical protein [Bacillus sp. 165]